MRRKILALLMIAGMMVLGVAGCGQSASSQENSDVQDSGSAESAVPENTGAPVVYMTTDISSEGLMAIYEAMAGIRESRFKKASDFSIREGKNETEMIDCFVDVNYNPGKIPAFVMMFLLA